MQHAAEENRKAGFTPELGPGEMAAALAEYGLTTGVYLCICACVCVCAWLLFGSSNTEGGYSLVCRVCFLWVARFTSWA
jgi:hypothetical protein